MPLFASPSCLTRIDKRVGVVFVVCYCLDRECQFKNRMVWWVLLDKWQFFIPSKMIFPPTNHCCSSHYFYVLAQPLFVFERCCLLRVAQHDWACRGSGSLSWLSILLSHTLSSLVNSHMVSPSTFVILSPLVSVSVVGSSYRSKLQKTFWCPRFDVGLITIIGVWSRNIKTQREGTMLCQQPLIVVDIALEHGCFSSYTSLTCTCIYVCI